MRRFRAKMVEGWKKQGSAALHRISIPDGSVSSAEARLHAAEARIEALLVELREIEAQDRFDADALAHLKAQLAEREDVIRRQTADIERLKALVEGNNERIKPTLVAAAMRALAGSLSLAKRK